MFVGKQGTRYLVVACAKYNTSTPTLTKAVVIIATALVTVGPNYIWMPFGGNSVLVPDNSQGKPLVR